MNSLDLIRAVARRILNPSLLRRRFTEIYRQGGFGGAESLSGTGSTTQQTVVIREALPILFKEFHARTVLDAPCGDFHWMRHVDMEGVQYIGMDIVRPLIKANRSKYGSPRRRFFRGDISKDEIPKVDIILCRDCLVHLPLATALEIVRNLKRSGSGYLLATTFPDIHENAELARVGNWRPLNLERAPFGFSSPLRLIREDCTEEDGRYADKSLGLWRLAEISC